MKLCGSMTIQSLSHTKGYQKQGDGVAEDHKPVTCQIHFSLTTVRQSKHYSNEDFIVKATAEQTHKSKRLLSSTARLNV